MVTGWPWWMRKQARCRAKSKAFPAARAHGVAVNSKGYTDDGEAFDLKTFKVLKRIKAQDDADGIAVDPPAAVFQ